VTDRRRSEKRLDALHDATRELVAVTSVDGIVDAVSRAAAEILDLSVHAVYRRETDRLVPVAATDRAEELFGDPPTIERGDGLVWDAVADGEVRTYADVTDHDGVYNPDTEIRSEFHVPIEGFGVFITASTAPDDFGDADVTLVKVLVANAEAALDRIDATEDEPLESA
jgi:PAS domain-containing protein